MATQGSDDIMALIGATEVTDSPSLTINNYSGGLGDYNVFDAISEEKEYAKRVSRDKLVNHLKERSNLRKAIRSGERTTGSKEKDTQLVNSSDLVDGLTNVLVGLGKDPSELEKYQTSTGGVEAINKLKQLQGGKFSGDIQNYIDGKSSKDATGLLADIFPEYMSSQGYGLASPEEMEYTEKADKGGIGSPDNRGAWEKMVEGASQFRWSDIGLESENRPLEKFINRGAGAYENARKTIAGLKSIGEWIMKETPEEFNKKIDEGQFYGDYEYDVNNGYKGSYEQWKVDTKAQYADEYQKAINQTKEIDKNKGNLWFNTVDEDSTAFDIGGLSTDVAVQRLLDAWITNAFKRGYRGYKALRLAKNVAKGTELVTKGTELAAPGTKVANTEKVAKESKDIATKVIDWFKKGGAKQDIVKGGLEGGKSGTEYQLIGDVQNGELSDAQTYGLSAGIGAFLGTLFGVGGAGGEAVAGPSEGLRTSLKRLGVEDVDEVLNWAEAAAKDHTLPSAKQRVRDAVVTEAKENVKKKLDSVGQDLGNFRKNLGRSDLTLEGDFIDPINKALSNKNIGAKIVKVDGKYVVDGYPKGYGDILNKVADSLNSLEYSVKEKTARAAAGEEVEFLSDVGMVEDLLADLKGFSMYEKDKVVQQKMIEIEKNILERVKKGMSPKQAADYEDYLNKYAANKVRYKKVGELEGVMNKGGIADQGKMSDGQYLSDFLEELYSDNAISKNAKDRRITARFADAIYGVPLKPGEKVPYPTKYGWLEEAQRRITKMINLPKNKVTGGWRKYAQDYVPSKTRAFLKKGAKQVKTTTIGKMAEQPREE